MAISDDNRFFKFLWRLNALLIAFFAVLGLLVGTYVLYEIVKDKTRNRSVQNVVNLAPDAVEEEKFVLGVPQEVEGSDYLKIPLNRVQNYGMEYYSKSADSEVNLMFFNIKDGSSRWLMPANAQLILSDQMLFDTVKSSDRPWEKNDVVREPLRIIYRVIEHDSDANGRMSAGDKISVFTSNIDGTGYSPLVESADKILMTNQTTDEQFMVMYNKDGQSLYQVFSVRDAKPVFNGKIDLKDAVPN